MKQQRLNDKEREEWVRNDEGLYLWWKREMRGERKLREFVRANRSQIDEAIGAATNPAPRETYGGRGFGPGASPAARVGRAGQSLMPRLY